MPASWTSTRDGTRRSLAEWSAQPAKSELHGVACGMSLRDVIGLADAVSSCYLPKKNVGVQLLCSDIRKRVLHCIHNAALSLIWPASIWLHSWANEIKETHMATSFWTSTGSSRSCQSKCSSVARHGLISFSSFNRPKPTDMALDLWHLRASCYAANQVYYSPTFPMTIPRCWCGHVCSCRQLLKSRLTHLAWKMPS